MQNLHTTQSSVHIISQFKLHKQWCIKYTFIEINKYSPQNIYAVEVVQNISVTDKCSDSLEVWLAVENITVNDNCSDSPEVWFAVENISDSLELWLLKISFFKNYIFHIFHF